MLDTFIHISGWKLKLAFSKAGMVIIKELSCLSILVM